MIEEDNVLVPEDGQAIEITPNEEIVDIPETEEIEQSVSPFTEENEYNELREKLAQVMAECRKIVVGQDDIVELMLICLVCEGHILLEGVPGVAKTLVAKTFAKTIDSEFSRIQFTPDLMPSDIIGTSIFNPSDGQFTFKRGPVFSNVILIDEINRSPAKTQSALFEVMEEKQISYDGKTYQMKFPYIVVATQNPVEQEGTYSLPEAQLDRFLMKIIINYPSFENELMILERFKSELGKVDLSEVNAILNVDDLRYLQVKTKEIEVSNDLLHYIVKLVHETRNHPDIYLGASPRASLAILKTVKMAAILRGRSFVIPDDIQYLLPLILGHRIILTPEAEISGKTPYTVINDIVKTVEVPR